MALHSKWSGGNLVFYDGTTTIMTIKDGTDGVLFSVSQADSAMADGYGFALEVDAHMTGTATSNAAAASAWLNISATLNAGGTYCARTDGIYSTGTVAGQLIFGARMQAQLSDSSFDRLCPWSIETGESTITALIDAGMPGGEVGWVATTGAAGSETGVIPFMICANDVKHYIRLYASS